MWQVKADERALMRIGFTNSPARAQNPCISTSACHRWFEPKTVVKVCVEKRKPLLFSMSPIMFLSQLFVALRHLFHLDGDRAILSTGL